MREKDNPWLTRQRQQALRLKHLATKTAQTYTRWLQAHASYNAALVETNTGRVIRCKINFKQVKKSPGT